jgi:DNA-binding IclR family transcriptional regulator
MATVRDRAILILELLARHLEGLQLIDIADGLDIPRGAAHRVLSDLKDAGYIRQDREGAPYRMTAKIVSLGFAYLSGNGITDVAQPVLDRLAATSGELVRLAVVDGDALRWVAKAQGATRGLRYDPDDGAEVYLAAAANGHAWLSCMDEQSALELVIKQGFRPDAYGPGAPRTLQDLIGFIDRTRERGFAIVIDSYEMGTSAVAAPVRASTGGVFATLSLAGPSARMTESRMLELAPDVMETARELATLAGVSPLFRTRGA